MGSLLDGNMTEIQQIWQFARFAHMCCVELYAENTPNVLDNVQKSALLLKMNSAFRLDTMVSERESLLILTDCKLNYSESQTSAC